jgi:agarase
VIPVDEARRSASSAFSPGTLRGREGYFRAGRDLNGRWWLIDPEGRAFFVRAVQGASASRSGGGPGPENVAVRLRRWGFNAVGEGGDGAGRDDGLACLAVVDFCRAGGPIVGPGLRLPDVFAPDWPQAATRRALEVCAPLAETRELLGWVTDDALGWAQPARTGRPSLLQICLSLEPGFATYHAAWEFALALHGGRIDALARAWGVPLANKEKVRELTRMETGLATRGYLRDEARWLREFARRYFATTAAAIRAADPNHLVLGCRLGAAMGSAVLAECVHPAVDVAMPDWRELPAATVTSGPLLASNVSWAEESFWQPAAPEPEMAERRGRMLTSVERMLRRGRVALERTARHPAVVGYAWAQWQDEPAEQPPFARGLVHVNGAEAREHTELLAQFNGRADALHRAAHLPIPS